MPSEQEVPILIRRFRGVDVSQDAAAIGVDALAVSDSWTPNPIFVLAKRQGQSLLRQIGTDFASTVLCAPLLMRTYDDSGNTYTLVIARALTPIAINDSIAVSLDDAVFLSPVNTTFTTNASLYGAAQLGQIIYVGNGINPLKAVNLGSPVTVTDDPFFITASGSSGAGAAGTPGSVPLVTTPDANGQWFGGTFSFAWCVFNSSTKKWTRRYDAQTFQDTQTGDHSYTFTAPSAALLANELYHLFVAQANLPIDLATDQSPGGVIAGTGLTTPAGALVIVRAVSVNGTVIPVVGASRRGNLLLAHRNRLWVSGDQTAGNASRVYATSVILPGAEQSLFDIQPYFPTNATLNVGRQDGDRVTALGRASITVTNQSPESPLLIFKNTETWAFFGDILNDPNARLLQLSAAIGCPAPFSVVETPVGTVFVGLESVYLVRADELLPVDIGFPIAPVIKTIPVARRGFSCAVYHRGFYKLAITPFGGTANTQQWWLDLRHGLGNPPSWWGPHTTPALVAFTNARQDTTEVDRADQLQSGGNFSAMDQAGVYRDIVDDGVGATTQAIVSQLRTSMIDDDAPHERKRFTRMRINARSNATSSSVGLQVIVDGGMAVGERPFGIIGSVGGLWNTATWNSSTWSSIPVFHEAESIFAPDRPRGVGLEAILTHSDASSLEMRDVELRYLPVTRPVQ